MLLRNRSGLSSSVAHYYLEIVEGPTSIVRPSSTSLLQFPGRFSGWLIEFLMVYIYRYVCIYMRMKFVGFNLCLAYMNFNYEFADMNLCVSVLQLSRLLVLWLASL